MVGKILGWVSVYLAVAASIIGAVSHSFLVTAVFVVFWACLYGVMCLLLRRATKRRDELNAEHTRLTAKRAELERRSMEERRQFQEDYALVRSLRGKFNKDRN